MEKLNIDELETWVDEILSGNSTNELPEVVHHLQVFASGQDETVRARALAALSKLAIKSMGDKRTYTISTIIKKADEAFNSGRFKDATEYYEQVLKIEPNSPKIRERLSETEQYLKYGSFPRELLPADAAIAYRRAEFYFMLGRHEDALESIDIAIDQTDKVGINNWKDGIDFRQRIEQQILIEKELGKIVEVAEYEDLQKAYDLLSKLNDEFLSSGQQKIISKVILNYERWEELRDQVINAQLRPGHIPSDRLIKYIDRAEYLQQRLPKNLQVNNLVADARDIFIRVQRLESLLQNAKTEMLAAQYIKALEYLDSAKQLFPTMTDEFQNLVHISQSNLAKQKKYYELMSHGRKFLDVENYEAAMVAFQEADELIHGKQPESNLNSDIAQNLIATEGSF